MLIARAPVPISFAGGGTDLEAYYAEYGGMVVSATIDKYFYVFLTPNQGGQPPDHILGLPGLLPPCQRQASPLGRRSPPTQGNSS